MLGQSRVGRRGVRARHWPCAHVLQGALADVRSGGETPQPLVRAPRKPRNLPHPVIDRATDPIIRIRPKGYSARRIEAASGVEQPLAPEAQ